MSSYSHHMTVYLPIGYTSGITEREVLSAARALVARKMQETAATLQAQVEALADAEREPASDALAEVEVKLVLGRLTALREAFRALDAHVVRLETDAVASEARWQGVLEAKRADASEPVARVA